MSELIDCTQISKRGDHIDRTTTLYFVQIQIRTSEDHKPSSYPKLCHVVALRSSPKACTVHGEHLNWQWRSPVRITRVLAWACVHRLHDHCAAGVSACMGSTWAPVSQGCDDRPATTAEGLQPERGRGAI